MPRIVARAAAAQKRRVRQSLLPRMAAAPTDAGQLLLERGQGILHQVERAREDLGRPRGGTS